MRVDKLHWCLHQELWKEAERRTRPVEHTASTRWVCGKIYATVGTCNANDYQASRREAASYKVATSGAKRIVGGKATVLQHLPSPPPRLHNRHTTVPAKQDARATAIMHLLFAGQIMTGSRPLVCPIQWKRDARRYALSHGSGVVSDHLLENGTTRTT
jgi:hypothetical protein